MEVEISAGLMGLNADFTTYNFICNKSVQVNDLIIRLELRLKPCYTIWQLYSKIQNLAKLKSSTVILCYREAVHCWRL